MYKLIAITKIYRFNSLFEIVVIQMKVLNKLQKEIIIFICTFIKSLNLSKV